MNELHEYILSLSPAVYIPFFLGDIRRRDTNAGAANLPTVTPSNYSPRWGRTKGVRYGFNNEFGGMLTIAAADCPQTDVANLTIFLGIDYRYMESSRFVVKRTVGGNTFDLSVQDANTVRFRDSNGNNRDTAVAKAQLEQAKSLCFVAETGQPGYLYLDGVNVGNTIATVTVAAESRDITVAAQYTGANTFSGRGMDLFIIFPSVLTAAQIWKLNRLLNDVRVGGHEWFKNPPKGDPAEPVIYLAGGRRGYIT